MATKPEFALIVHGAAHPSVSPLLTQLSPCDRYNVYQVEDITLH